MYIYRQNTIHIYKIHMCTCVSVCVCVCVFTVTNSGAVQLNINRLQSSQQGGSQM